MAQTRQMLRLSVPGQFTVLELEDAIGAVWDSQTRQAYSPEERYRLRLAHRILTELKNFHYATTINGSHDQVCN